MISGLAMAARTADKARVVASGVVGNVDYNCSMDRQLFAFIGADATEYLNAVTSSADDSGVARFVSDRVASKSDEAISAYNDILLGVSPTEGTEEVGWFLEAREKRGRGRTDIFTWPDHMNTSLRSRSQINGVTFPYIWRVSGLHAVRSQSSTCHPWLKFGSDQA